MVRVCSLFCIRGEALQQKNKKEAKPMEVKFFKDQLFDLPNDSDSMGISDIETDDRNNIFTIKTIDESVFEIECRQIK